MKPDPDALLKSLTSMPKASEVADTARPAYAVTMWSDDNWIYVELPCDGDPPYITKFAFSEGGLSKALYVLRSARKNRPPSTVSASKPAAVGHIARITHPRLKQPAPKTTPEQQAQARDILRKLKIFR